MLVPEHREKILVVSVAPSPNARKFSRYYPSWYICAAFYLILPWSCPNLNDFLFWPLFFFFIIILLLLFVALSFFVVVAKLPFEATIFAAETSRACLRQRLPSAVPPASSNGDGTGVGGWVGG